MRKPQIFLTNIPAAASSSVTQFFEVCGLEGRAVNAQGIPSDDGVLYGGFEKIHLEVVINLWTSCHPSCRLCVLAHPLHHTSQLGLTVIIIRDHGRRGLHD